MESTDSSGGPPPQPNLPPGFRFHPTDEELVVHYLKRKAASAPLPVAIIADVDLYKFDPWELPAKASFGEHEWYFFSPRDRKYPNGARPNRAATSGYWKATGTDKPVLASNGNYKVGVKKALVFYSGKPPKGIKSDWIMHEYRLIENKPNNRPPGCDFGNKKNSLRLDDWVLCRIYKKNNAGRHMDTDKDHDVLDYVKMKVPPSLSMAAASGFHNNVSRSSMNFFPGKYSAGYGIFPNGDPFYDGGIINNNISIANGGNSLYHNNGNTIGLNHASSSGPIMMTNVKRSLPVPYWPVTEEENEVSPSKRFHGDGDCSNMSTSMIEETPPLMQQQAGIFRTASYQLPELNWYSS